MNKGIVKEGILGVLNLRWHSLFKNYRNRVKNDAVAVGPYAKEAIAESK
jgi:dolichol-phosphate mannosyltransferase